MTLKTIGSPINGIYSESSLINFMNYVCNLASITLDHKAYSVYADATWWIATGRLSGLCTHNIRQNIKTVCKWLNSHTSATNEQIGDYLKTYAGE